MMRGHLRRAGAFRLAYAAPLVLVPAIAIAQEAPTTPSPTEDPVGTLMMFTLGVALAIGVLLLANFLRKRSNRDAMRSTNNE
ncbi:MAG: hypothetical protein K2Q28_16815 [Hyphomicrobium sp.]|nr:hypothetical protein [Hyphomicrobium sp.]